VSKSNEQPLFDYAAIEGGIFAERLATLGNLVRVMNASIYDAHVLRYVFDRGGCDRAVELPVAQMADSPWIHCSEKTVRRSLDFWEIRRILEIERDRRDERGCQLPHSGRLCWSSVLQQLLGVRSSVSERPLPSADLRDQSDCHGGRTGGLSVPGDGLSVPAGGLCVPSDGQPVPGDGQRVHRLTPISHSPIRVRPRAAGSSIQLTVIVDDVNCGREVSFAEIWELAEEARRIIWPGKWPRDPEVKQLFARGAILALCFFSREWILLASRVTKRKRPNHPSSYWVAALRNGLTESQGYPEFETLGEARSHISQLLHSAAVAAAEVVAECDQVALVSMAAVAPPSDPATPDMKKEFLARLEKFREAST